MYLKEYFKNPLIKDNTDVQFTQENNLCLQFFNKTKKIKKQNNQFW